MARVPGTEAPRNDAGWRPGDLLRCRRSRSNAALGLADQQAVAIEVRASHVRVLLDASGRSTWLESGQLLPHQVLDDPQLARIAGIFGALQGHRLEAEDDELVIFSEGFDAHALAGLGLDLTRCRIEARGVHEVGVRLPAALEFGEPLAE